MLTTNASNDGKNRPNQDEGSNHVLQSPKIAKSTSGVLFTLFEEQEKPARLPSFEPNRSLLTENSSGISLASLAVTPIHKATSGPAM